MRLKRLPTAIMAIMLALALVPSVAMAAYPDLPTSPTATLEVWVDDVAFFEDAGPRDSVDHFVVHGGADLSGESVITVERADSASIANHFLREVSELKSGDTGLGVCTYGIANAGGHLIDPTHGIELGSRLDDDHKRKV